MLGLVAVLIAEWNSSAVQASDQYQASRRQLDSQLQAAARDGYTRVDLATVYVRESEIESRSEPLWVGDRETFYRGQLADISSLRTELRGRQAEVLAGARAGATSDVAAAAAQLAHDQDIGVDPGDLQDLQAKLKALQSTDTSSGRLADLRAASTQAQDVKAKLVQVGAAQEVENQAILAAAAQLKSDKQGNLDAIRQAGQAALAAARNDATTATFLDREKKLVQPLNAVNVPYSRAERFAAKLSAADLDTVATGAAAEQRYAGQVHSALMAGMPAKAIVISYQAQELWAYESSKQVLDTLVTTGRPQLPTDIGPMSALWKSSPWTMHSPWPKDSPWWYPDTVVQQVVWFTNTGEGLHDASWEYSWQYGPGGQYGGGASHGCIHLEAAPENFLFNWTDIGTPVLVIPGDGSPVANQVAQITVDAQGNPTTGPKGA